MGIWEGSLGCEFGGVTNGKILAFGGVEVQLPIFGPAGAGGNEFDVICIEEAVCSRMVG